jgi:hypothetical protein
VQILGGGGHVLYRDDRRLPEATDTSLEDNERIVDMFQKAGVDLESRATNRAEGKPVSASFTTTSPPLRATSPGYAVDGFTISGLPASGPAGQARPGYIAPNTIWGACSDALPTCGDGSPDDQQWLEVDLEKSYELDTVKLYFFNDKSYNPQQNNSNNTYREPSQYVLQYHDGRGWVDIPGQVRTPATPQANYNLVTFHERKVRRLRVLMTRTGDFGIGVKEIQAFDMRRRR